MERQPEIVKLGQVLRDARELKRLSARQLADQVGVNHRTIAMLEQGLIEQPKPDKLSRLGRALALDPNDLLNLAGYADPSRLPAFPVYLRTTTGLPDAAIEELNGHYAYLKNKYGLSTNGPAAGEDEDDNE